MLKSTSARIILVLLAALVLAAGGWLYTRRAQRIEIAAYVPESALGYAEINSLPRLLDQLISSDAWQQIAPAYGITNKWSYLAKAGQAGWLASLAGNSETAIISRAQIAFVVTSLEVRGETIKPRLALLAETHSSAAALQTAMEKRLPELAQTLFGQAVRETSEYGGVPVVSFSAGSIGGSERKLMAARIEGELILANHEEPLRACIDTRLGRAPAIANNFYLPKARPVVGSAAGGEVSIFGFVTGEGVKRLLRFGTYLATGGVVGKAALAGAVGDVFTDFSAKTCDGIAYGASFENGQVVDRYAMLFKPELTETLKTIIKTNAGSQQTNPALNLVPTSAREVMVVNIANPSQTLDGIEKAISSRVDAAQSFLLHQFVIGMREAAFGSKSNELTAAAVGDHIVSFNSSKEPLDRVWLIAAKDHVMMTRLAESILTQFPDKRIAAIRREDFAGFQIMSSSESFRGSAVFIGDVLALGEREQLLRLIEAHRTGQSLKTTPQFTATSKALPAAPLLGFSSVKEESNEMMMALARASGLTLIPAHVAALDQLPLAASATSIHQQGLFIESRSPFGNLPFLISLTNGSTDRKE